MKKSNGNGNEEKKVKSVKKSAKSESVEVAVVTEEAPATVPAKEAKAKAAPAKGAVSSPIVVGFVKGKSGLAQFQIAKPAVEIFALLGKLRDQLLGEKRRSLSQTSEMATKLGFVEAPESAVEAAKLAIRMNAKTATTHVYRRTEDGSFKSVTYYNVKHEMGSDRKKRVLSDHLKELGL